MVRLPLWDQSPREPALHDRPGRRSPRTSNKVRGETFVSASHEAFALTFRPGERIFHFFALRVFQAHFGQRRLGIDLLRNFRRRRRSGDRQLLLLVRIWIVVERPLRWFLLRPNLQLRELLIGW